MPDPILSLAEIRALPDLSEADRYSDDLVTDLVTEFEQILARHPQGRFGAQARTVTRRSAGPGLVLLEPGATLTAVTVNGVEVTDLDSLTVDGAGLVSGGWWGHSTTTLIDAAYTTARATPPALKRACGLFVWREAMGTVNPNTGNSYLTTNADLGVVERASTADWSANPPRPTGWQDVDRLVNQVLSPPIGIG